MRKLKKSLGWSHDLGHSLFSLQNKLKTLNHRTEILILVLVLKLSWGHGPGPVCRDYPGLNRKVRLSSDFSVHPHSPRQGAAAPEQSEPSVLEELAR